MASIQERLHLKRVPLDTWNVREQLCLASAVVRSGDQNWMSVSRALKTVGEPNRPPDWYSQKSCAAQYGALLEHVETPKRKKRSSEGAVETPQESIVKRLTQERIAEIQKNIAEMNQQYEQLKGSVASEITGHETYEPMSRGDERSPVPHRTLLVKVGNTSTLMGWLHTYHQNEISEVRNQSTSEERLREIWSGIEATKRASERENARRAALMKEREERRARAARSSSVTPAPTSPSATPSTPSSPLLTSLLKSSPVVTTPQHMTHPASVVDTVSPSVTAPTLSMLLEKSSPQQDSKRAAIEHIKSQLVQIEQQLKANTPPPPTPLAPAPTPLDIDDIEINAEDVYVFRDVDIHIPAVSHASDKSIEKPEMTAVKKVEDDTVDIEVESVTPMQDVVINKEEKISIGIVKEEVPIDVEIVPKEEVKAQDMSEDPVTTETNDLKISVPEVKFPTTEIIVKNPDEQKIKEESKEVETGVEETEQDVEEEIVVHEEIPEDSVEQQLSDLHAEPERGATPPPQGAPSPPHVDQTAPPDTSDVIETEDIPLPPEPQNIETEDIPLPPEPQDIEAPLLTEPEVAPVQGEQETEEKDLIQDVTEERPETQPEVAVVEPQDDKTADDFKRDEDAEDSIPLKQMIRDECLRTIREERITDDTHTETDDDTPMELSREEEKDGKKKRDYSRKKKPDSRTCSGSESAAEASAPESPSASDAERRHRLWKKSVMLVYSRLCTHKYASLFLRPITDEEAPGYSLVVRRPMDLSTIRKNIENGIVRTTAEFQRDVLLMFSNALMYNSSEHSVHSMAKEMHEEAVCQLSMLLAAQAHAGLVEAPPSRRKRRRPDSPRVYTKRQP